ncbi:MAG: two-component system response regulator OmpR [Gammaproteobacteria bacterium 28-57-27]|nr:MAG: two-component system response regulator OmpR [Gammaproteobacteria bacterium 28-57-27]
MSSIWVIDDDEALRDLLLRYLGEQGFAVRGMSDGLALDQALLEGARPDVFLLDLMLPGEDGLSIARRLRAGGSAPIIMLSARGEDLDRIIGLEVGADDYLAKPFNPRELLARIRAVLRRVAQSDAPVLVEPASPPGSAARVRPASILEQAGFRMDLDVHRLTLNGEEIALTEGEFQLLRALMQQPRRLLSREQLLDDLRGLDRSPFDRSMDVRVTRLRRKIEPDPSQPRYLLTIRGEGYVFIPEGRAAP